jgi:1-deoxy-D-xylulose-5-phosphate reductoisomerase
VALLGSTGSIGTQTLAVIEALNQRGHNFSVVALAAGKNIELLAAQALRFRPRSSPLSGLRISAI